MSNPTTQLVNDMVESDAEFRKQFDRSDPNYHGGDSTAVPLGGQTVPKGMEAHADWKALPEAPTDAAETDYGPEYNRLMELRTFFGDLKKALSVLPVHVEAASKYSKKAATASTAEKAKLETETQEEDLKREKVVADIEVMLKGREGGVFDEMVPTIAELLKQSADAPTYDKEKYFDWATAMKRMQQQCFAEMKKLLQDIKEAKKKATAQ
jgi:hypothetical protein